MEKTPLLHTKSGRERIVVAIQWDERADKATIIDSIRGTNQQHDLDLSCFVYDSHGTYIDFIGPMAQDSMDQTGCIYHSGDDATGSGGGDDEFISVELAGLPEDTAQIVFLTEIRSNHVFSQVLDPYARVADGKTNKNLLEHHMFSVESHDKQACVMFKISRNSASPTGWELTLIDSYPRLDEVSDWGSFLTRYL